MNKQFISSEPVSSNMKLTRTTAGRSYSEMYAMLRNTSLARCTRSLVTSVTINDAYRNVA